MYCSTEKTYDNKAVLVSFMYCSTDKAYDNKAVLVSFMYCSTDKTYDNVKQYMKLSSTALLS
jgi:hypothetical protein